jgi:hypothetical protein
MRTQRRTARVSTAFEPAATLRSQPRAVKRGTESIAVRPEGTAALRATARAGHFRCCRVVWPVFTWTSAETLMASISLALEAAGNAAAAIVVAAAMTAKCRVCPRQATDSEPNIGPGIPRPLFAEDPARWAA